MTARFDATSTAHDVLAGVDLKGQRFLVTGASSGLGLETTRALVSRGATVIGASREDVAGAERATTVLRDEASRAGGRLELMQLDLGSLHNVREFANRRLAAGERFDAVIANAGIMAPPLGRTVDGFELQFAINFLGHLALLEWIEPLIVDEGRVVVLSSQAHRVSDIDLDDLNFERQEYDPFVAYGRSKTAAALLAVEFDRRHRDRGIRAASVMPGNSLTNLPRYFSPEQLAKLFATVGNARAEAGLPPAVLKTIPQAAATSVWAAVVANKDEIGGRYLEDCAVARIDDTANPFADGVKSYALDAGKAKQLWTTSEALIEGAMSNTTLRDFYGRYIGALNARNFDVMDEFIHDEVTLNGKPATREDILAIQREEAGAVPDLRWELTNLIIDGNRLGAQLVNTGTPAKPFVGVHPTGASFEVVEYAVYQVIDGRFKHMAAIHDAEAVKRQLSA